MEGFHSMTNVDGVITRTEDARVPVMDRGFLYGDSIYEVFRTYGGVPLLYDEHWARFENSAALISFQIGLSKEQMADEIRQTIEMTNAAQSGRDVYAARLDASGALLDATAIVVSRDFGSQQEPKAAWNGQNWLVVWEHQVPSGTELSMALVSSMSCAARVASPMVANGESERYTS